MSRCDSVEQIHFICIGFRGGLLWTSEHLGQFPILYDARICQNMQKVLASFDT
jgi:hypothetical protein